MDAWFYCFREWSNWYSCLSLNLEVKMNIAFIQSVAVLICVQKTVGVWIILVVIGWGVF